jgi:hypothetical protein
MTTKLLMSAIIILLLSTIIGIGVLIQQIDILNSHAVIIDKENLIIMREQELLDSQLVIIEGQKDIKQILLKTILK